MSCRLFTKRAPLYICGYTYPVLQLGLFDVTQFNLSTFT